MTEAPLHDPQHSTDAALAKADKFELLLKQCETKAMGEAEAQEVADWLDQVNSELPQQRTD